MRQDSSCVHMVNNKIFKKSQSNYSSIYTWLITKHLFFHHSNFDRYVGEKRERERDRERFQQAINYREHWTFMNIACKLDYVHFALWIL